MARRLKAAPFCAFFLSADEAKQKTTELIGPILIFVGALFVVALLVQLLPRNKPQSGKYGISGGAVCPKCELPISIHFFSFHAGWNNWERCPHCGKWSWVRKAKPEDLRAAEARWKSQE